MSMDTELSTIADPSLDQHFLVSETKLAELVEAAGIRPTDRVVELGAGVGTVARALPPCASLTVIEFDARLSVHLEKSVPHARVINGDALEVIGTLACDVLIGSLPHWVTDRLMGVLHEVHFRNAVLATGDAAELSRLGDHFEWQLIDSLTGDDFLPPQTTVSLLVKVSPKRFVQHSA